MHAVCANARGVLVRATGYSTKREFASLFACDRAPKPARDDS